MNFQASLDRIVSVEGKVLGKWLRNAKSIIDIEAASSPSRGTDSRVKRMVYHQYHTDGLLRRVPTIRCLDVQDSTSRWLEAAHTADPKDTVQMVWTSD
jgi:hypothetical protein